MATSTPKRKLVDADSGQDIGETKRQKIELNSELKTRVLRGILLAAKGIFTLLPATERDWKNINLNTQVANTVFTCHNILRQRAQTPGVARNMDAKTAAKDFSFTIAGQQNSVKRDAALKAVQDAFAVENLEYCKYDMNDRNNWYGMCGPYLDFFVGFEYRMQELRIGHNEMCVGKDGQTEKKFLVSKYGIMPNHHILLEGLGFPPEKRASMAQSVGPLTALLCYLRVPDQFKEKWKNACLRSMGHIPYIKDLLEVLKGKSAFDCSTVITLLADTLLLVGTRNAHRLFFPILIYSQAIGTGDNEEELRVPDKDILGQVDFSGKGAFYVYNKMCGLGQMKMYGANITDTTARQIVYHCMFGTFKEDLNLLAKITDQGTWYTRSEIGNHFQKLGSSDRSCDFNLIKQKSWSKLASANITGLLSASYTQLSFQGVFSGRRFQTFSKEFYDSLGRGMGTSVSARSLEDLQSVARKTLMEVLKIVRKNNDTIQMGTVEWYDVASTTLAAKGTQVSVQMPATHKYFLGAPSEENE